jgi:hypothetical protein
VTRNSGATCPIKILPDAFVIDPERVARFEREAQGARRAESSEHCRHLRA